MRKILIAISFAAFLFTACNNSDAAADSTITVDSSLANSVKSTVTPVVPTVAADSSQPAVASGVTVTPAATGAPGSAGINPAHGQPGHRCDIAVGAPLNSPVAKPVTTTNTTPQQVTAAAPEVKTAPGMNPPHGQPGHRCDISVGAPLNSPVAKPVTPTTTSTPASSQPSAVEGMVPVATDKENSGKK